MGSPISPMEAIEIIEKAIALYKKVKDTPEQINKIARRMERLDLYLHELADLLDRKKNPGGLASLRPTSAAQLEAIIKDVKADGQEVYTILRKWDENIGPKGLAFKFDWFAHLVFALGSSPDKLDTLAENIEQHLNDVNKFIVLLIAFAHNQQPNNKQWIRAPPSPDRRRSPSPGPREKNIVFVDGYNVGRSKVAEAYCRLLTQWTRKAGGEWKLNKTHSAGILPQTKSAYATELVALGTKMIHGGRQPTQVAMDSLFDNKWFEYPYKNVIKEQVSHSKSRGLAPRLFSVYDYIVVFTKGHEVKMIKLREMITEKHGNSARPKGKGKIVLLGDYLTGKPGSEIFEPNETRENWNRSTSVIKGSIKSFLKKELKWVQPPLGQ
jgi:hypothetical protein